MASQWAEVLEPRLSTGRTGAIRATLSNKTCCNWVIYGHITVRVIYESYCNCFDILIIFIKAIIRYKYALYSNYTHFLIGVFFLTRLVYCRCDLRCAVKLTNHIIHPTLTIAVRGYLEGCTTYTTMLPALNNAHPFPIPTQRKAGLSGLQGATENDSAEVWWELRWKAQREE